MQYGTLGGVCEFLERSSTTVRPTGRNFRPGLVAISPCDSSTGNCEFYTNSRNSGIN